MRSNQIHLFRITGTLDEKLTGNWGWFIEGAIRHRARPAGPLPGHPAGTGRLKKRFLFAQYQLYAVSQTRNLLRFGLLRRLWY